ncbi:hypothetical protein LUZ61_002852 [Rhynchospora tenuis]|uniref:Uncharacterized protein n=1 Tax=Rhynchospora tenuis TaxID=198213 RepID=A0AAD6ES47_9POAL|nr:hypothetical protein LUZ61_002852 [Rhynchospora tenuis]
MDQYGGNSGLGFTLLKLPIGLRLTMLTSNSVLAVYRVKEDAWSVAFDVSAYFALVLLFWCLQLYERTPLNAPAQRWKLKLAVWSLTTFLTSMFSYNVALLIPWPVALIVWALAICRSQQDAWSVASFVSAYLTVVVLFWRLQLYEITAPNAAQRWKLKVAIWSFSTFLTSMFSYKVALLMPWPVALIIWALVAYRAKEDVWFVAFVVSAYFALVLLFWCLRLYERTAPNAAQRWKLKVAVWSLSTFLTSMFSYKVALLMPGPVALIIWAMAGTVICGGFYAFFMHQNL